MELSPAQEQALIAAVQGGLPLTGRPYARLGEIAGLSEEQVIGGLQKLLAGGLIKRMGVVVRHHELGYRANAMVVWDLPDERVDEIGGRMRRFGFVTLCYRRPRRPPRWPYNLFCMIHGRDRSAVRRHVEELAAALELSEYQVLFSVRRFKQCAAVYRRAG